MAIDHVLAVVPVTDIASSSAWYESFFGRAPDNNPMPTLVEWQAAPAGWVQVSLDPDRAGSTLLNFAVDDLTSHIAQLSDRGLHTEPIKDANKGVQLSAINDPDGNRIPVIGGFRVTY